MGNSRIRMQFSSSSPYLNGFYGGGECSTLCSPGKSSKFSKVVERVTGFVMEFTPNSMLLKESVEMRRILPVCLRGWLFHPFALFDVVFDVRKCCKVGSFSVHRFVSWNFGKPWTHRCSLLSKVVNFVLNSLICGVSCAFRRWMKTGFPEFNSEIFVKGVDVVFGVSWILTVEQDRWNIKGGFFWFLVDF